MSFHGSIVNLLVSLGYTKSEGCCCGFSLKWLEACLLGEEHLFNKRTITIVKEGVGLVQKINAAKEKKGKNLTQSDKELLDILAFYDSLELYQSPEVHCSLFNAPLRQGNVENISNVASSGAILSRGGLTQIYSEPVIYTQKEIKKYINRLGVVIENACVQSKEPLGIVLSSNNHAIALTYTPGKGWKFMDINQYPSKSFKLNQTHLLAKSIKTGFMQSNSPYSAFTVSIFTTGNNVRLLNLKETFEPFKKSHPLTKKITSRETAEGIGLARIAAQYGHASVMVKLATFGGDLNKADREGITSAYIAAQEGHASVIAELAKHGVDLNQAISNGATPVYIAAQNGHVSVIAELAKHGVDLNQAISNGVTPALIAAQNGHVSVIAELAKHGVDLNQAISNGVTPALIAAHNGHASVIAELAKHGVDLNQGLSNGVTPALIAAQNGHTSVIAELAKHPVDLNQAAKDGSTLAIIAAQNGHTSVIAELAKHKIDFNKSKSNGVTPAYIAAQNGYASVIAELAKWGVDFNKAKSNGATPVYIAAQNGHSFVIAELAKHHVDLNQALTNGVTLAYIAAQQGHASVIAELAKYKVNINQVISNGTTPAFIAAQYGHVSVIAELIKVGVNFDIPYVASVAGLRQFAISCGDNMTKQMNNFLNQLLALSPKIKTISMTPYRIALVMGHDEIMQLLNNNEEQKRKKRLNASHQLMEQTKRGHNKSLEVDHSFFSTSVKQGVSSSGVKRHPQQEFSNVY